MGPKHKEQLRGAGAPRAQSYNEAEAAQLIELGWPCPATRATPALALPPVPGRRRRSWGTEGLIEGRRCRRLSPGPRLPLPPEIIPLSRRPCAALGAPDPQLNCDSVINGDCGRELARGGALALPSLGLSSVPGSHVLT